jgi:Spy/CpxP family protein refolding chaperone
MEQEMHRLIMSVAAAAICVTAAAPASAQGGPSEDMRGFRSIARLCGTDQQWTTERMGERLARRLNLTDQQKPALKALQDAVAKAKGDAKAVLCTSSPDLSTLPARMLFAQKRLQARLDGLRAVQPKLEAFYSGLTGEQQAEFNHLWQHRGMRGEGGEGGWQRGEGGMRGGQDGWRGGRMGGDSGDDD